MAYALHNTNNDSAQMQCQVTAWHDMNEFQIRNAAIVSFPSQFGSKPLVTTAPESANNMLRFPL